MTINGIDFDFSTLNANDVDRMLAAQTRQQERARTEGRPPTLPSSDYPCLAALPVPHLYGLPGRGSGRGCF